MLYLLLEYSKDKVERTKKFSTEKGMVVVNQDSLSNKRASEYHLEALFSD